jgi:hypothetical protein
MRHDQGSSIFNVYLNQRVKFDVQAAFLERPSADHLLKMFAHMSLTCDPRAPVDVPDEVLSRQPPDPKLITLTSLKEELKLKIYKEYGSPLSKAKGTQLYDQYQRCAANIQSTRTAGSRRLKKEYRRNYFAKRHTEEIERQLNGVGGEEYVEPDIQHQLPERKRLQQILCEFTSTMDDGEIHQRRIVAVNAMIALSCRQEVQLHKKRQARYLEAAPKVEDTDEEPFPLPCGEKQCIDCLHNKSLAPAARAREFSRTSTMWDHFERFHLLNVEGGSYLCRACSLGFLDAMHFKNHVATVHGIFLRP